MTSFTSPAIIMRTMALGESDLLVTFFTSEQGKLKGVAKGAQRSRKRFVNALDIFSLVEMEFNLPRKGSLHFLHSSRLIDSFPGLRSNYRFLGIASFMIELTEHLFPWELADKKMFDTLQHSFKNLASGKNPDEVSTVFEIIAMSLGGFGINLEKCCCCGRSYSGEGTAVFLSTKGGIACLGCESVTAITPGLTPDEVMVLKSVQSDFAEALEGLDLSDKILDNIRPVLRIHREYQLGKRLKTARYLERE